MIVDYPRFSWLGDDSYEKIFILLTDRWWREFLMGAEVIRATILYEPVSARLTCEFPLKADLPIETDNDFGSDYSCDVQADAVPSFG